MSKFTLTELEAMDSSPSSLSSNIEHPSAVSGNVIEKLAPFNIENLGSPPPMRSETPWTTAASEMARFFTLVLIHCVKPKKNKKTRVFLLKKFQNPKLYSIFFWGGFNFKNLGGGGGKIQTNCIFK